MNPNVKMHMDNKNHQRSQIDTHLLGDGIRLGPLVAFWLVACGGGDAGAPELTAGPVSGVVEDRVVAAAEL